MGSVIGYQEAHGPVATFETDVAGKIKKLEASIEPVQDLHGYDYPWPAGGGKNLFNVDTPSIVDGYITGTGFSSANTKAKTVYIQINPNTTYTVSKLSGQRFAVATAQTPPSNEANFTQRNTASTASALTITSGANDAYLWAFVYLQDTDTVTLDAMLASLQIEVGSVASAWTPYSNICPITGWTGAKVNVNSEIIDITFPSAAGTVYGGKLDVVKGELVVDKAIVSANTSTMNNSQNYPGWSDMFDIGEIVGYGVNRRYNGITNIGTHFGVNTTYNSSKAKYNDVIHLAKDHYGMTQDEWIALNLDVQIIVPLATPITYQLTPQEINTIIGTNTIYADTGDTSVIYPKTITPVETVSNVSLMELRRSIMMARP